MAIHRSVELDLLSPYRPIRRQSRSQLMEDNLDPAWVCDSVGVVICQRTRHLTWLILVIYSAYR